MGFPLLKQRIVHGEKGGYMAGLLDHVKVANLQGILSPTTKAMLEEAERRVAECEAAIIAVQEMPAEIQPPSSSINSYLEDLRGVLETDTERARRLLAKMLGKVTLRRDGDRLLADVKGNLPDLLDVDKEVFGRAGAGRGISSLAYWPLVTGAVA